MAWFDGFELRQQTVAGRTVRYRISQPAQWTRTDKPVLLLLHGFPQTHVMWHRVAQHLAQDYRLVMPDLRGYGDSSCEPGEPDHANYSKRALAQEVIDLLDSLQVDRFYLCGHDRGGRVAHRLALDHPQRVLRLCVLDIAPTLDMYAATDFEFAKAYYHWFHLIQPAPVPEFMIAGAPRDYLKTKLGGWGNDNRPVFEPEALEDYERCFCKPETNILGWPAAIHAKAEDYRAGASIDLVHDQASRDQGQRIGCDVLVLWGERGVVNRLFEPLRLWQAQCAAKVTGQAVPAGHYIAEELPEQTAQALREFMV
jgi:haloacetate dehalogenase